MKSKNIKQILLGDQYQREGNKGKQMVKKGEYYRFTLYGCMKMEH
jgi:hypothetical protein